MADPLKVFAGVLILFIIIGALISQTIMIAAGAVLIVFCIFVFGAPIIIKKKAGLPGQIMVAPVKPGQVQEPGAAAPVQEPAIAPLKIENADKDDPRSNPVKLIGKRVPKMDRVSSFFADKIPLVSFEKNGSELRFETWSLDSSNVARNDDRGKAVDLGGAKPIRVISNNQIYIGFMVDGDRGVGVDLSLDTTALSTVTKARVQITNTAEEAWSFIQSAKLARVFTDDITGRSKFMYMAAGGIITLIGYFILLRFL
jgi:hypothetical protein